MYVDQGRGDALSSGQRPGRGDALRRHQAAIATPVAYVALSCWLFWPLLRHLRSSQMGGPDTELFTWWLGWTPWAISHGHNPFLSTWINSPHGVNAMWNTSVPLLGVLMWPVTATLGAVATVNLLLLLAPALSAWSAFLAGRVLGLRPRSSFLVGFLYGFSTYTLAQDAAGHLHLSMAVFPPLVAALLAKIIDGSVSSRRGGLLLGVAGVLQIWISEEILATSGLLTVLVLVVYGIRCPRDEVVAAGRRLLRAAGWAAAVAAPLAAPAVIIQFFGSGHLTSGVLVPGLSTDLISPVIPTRQTLIHQLFSDSVLNRIQQGYSDELTGYVGLPLLVLIVLARRRHRSTHLRWCWTPLLIAGILAVGHTFLVYGHSLRLPGPGRILARLPVLDSILVPRFSLYFVLFGAFLAAAAWDAAQVGAMTGRRWTTALVALTVAAVLPWPTHAPTRITEPAAFAAGHPLPGLPDGARVAILPWPTTSNDNAMRWQVLDKMHFRLIGAYGIVAGPGGVGQYGTRRPTLDRVTHHISGDRQPPPRTGGPEERQELAELAALRHEAQALIIGPGGDSATVASYVGTLLNETPTHTGGIWIFPLPGH